MTLGLVCLTSRLIYFSRVGCDGFDQQTGHLISLTPFTAIFRGGEILEKICERLLIQVSSQFVASRRGDVNVPTSITICATFMCEDCEIATAFATRDVVDKQIILLTHLPPTPKDFDCKEFAIPAIKFD